jgi:peptide/nickel transport system permease protein
LRQFILKRLGQSVLLLFLISLLVFGILQLVPGGPLDQLAFSNPRITPEQFHNLEKLLGLDRPAHERYFTWLLGVLHGDLGSSWSVYYGRPVLSTIVGRLPLTLELMVISTIIALLIAIPVGILAAVRQYSRLDYAVTALSYFGISMPVFDPVDLLRHLVLPVTVLSIFNVAQFSRYIRSSMLEVLKQDYIRTARAKGLIERFVILKHGLRNGMIPLITLLGLELPVLFSGAVITETIFSWPGMGRLFYDAIVQTDWPLVQGILLFSAFLVLIGNLFADVMYAVVDPRIRY